MTNKKSLIESLGLKEIRIKEEKIGFVIDSAKIAFLTPIVLIQERNHELYNKRVDELDRQGYEIAYNHPNEKPQEVTHERVYDILQPLSI